MESINPAYGLFACIVAFLLIKSQHQTQIFVPKSFRTKIIESIDHVYEFFILLISSYFIWPILGEISVTTIIRVLLLVIGESIIYAIGTWYKKVVNTWRALQEKIIH